MLEVATVLFLIGKFRHIVHVHLQEIGKKILKFDKISAGQI